MSATTACHLSRPRQLTLLGAGAAAVAGVFGVLVRLLGSDTAAARPPRPVSHVGTATRACLLTSTDSDPGVARTWAAMQQLAGGGTSSVVVQRHRLPDEADGETYVNTLAAAGIVPMRKEHERWKASRKHGFHVLRHGYASVVLEPGGKGCGAIDALLGHPAAVATAAWTSTLHNPRDALRSRMPLLVAAPLAVTGLRASPAA